MDRNKNREFLQDELKVFVVPIDILKIDLTIHEKMVYVVLRSFANNHDLTAFPSYETIAKLGSMSRRHAMRCVESLIEKGLLKKEVRLDVTKHRKIRNTSNLYTIKSPNVVTVSHQGSDSQSPRVVTVSHQGSDSQSPELNHLTKPKRTNSLNKNNNNKEKHPSEVIKPIQENENDVVVDFLSKNGLEVNGNTIKRWKKLDSDDKIIQAISETLEKDKIKNVIGYVTRILESGYTPTPAIKTVSKKSDVPEYEVERNDGEQKTVQINIEQQKEVLDLLFQLGEISKEDYDLQLKQLIEQ